MLDLLEELRLCIVENKDDLSADQILTVIASLIQDHSGVAFHHLSSHPERKEQ